MKKNVRMRMLSIHDVLSALRFQYNNVEHHLSYIEVESKLGLLRENEFSDLH